MWGQTMETLADEILMGLLIRKGVYAEFPPDFGLALDLDLQQPTPSLQRAAIQGDIASQIPLHGDPTVLPANGFTFQFGPGDSAWVQFTLRPTVGADQVVSIPYGASESIA